MTVDIAQELARAKASAARHRSADRVLVTLALLACVTVIVTWLLGRFLLRGTLGRTEGAGVFDVSARNNGEYFLSDWTAGCALVLGLLGVLLVVRPWGLRVGFGVVGIVSMLAGAALGIVSVREWRDAELTTAGALVSTAFPWADRYYSCGGTQTFVDGAGAIWQAFTGRGEGSASDGCDRVLVYRGWEEVGRIQLQSGESVDELVSDEFGNVTIHLSSGAPPYTFAITAPPS